MRGITEKLNTVSIYDRKSNAKGIDVHMESEAAVIIHSGSDGQGQRVNDKARDTEKSHTVTQEDTHGKGDEGRDISRDTQRQPKMYRV